MKNYGLNNLEFKINAYKYCKTCGSRFTEKGCNTCPDSVEVMINEFPTIAIENENLKQEVNYLKQKIKSLESQLEEMTQRYLYR